MPSRISLSAATRLEEYVTPVSKHVTGRGFRFFGLFSALFIPKPVYMRLLN